MATIDLITYDQKMVTPKDDALIHQFGISNGVLYGCDVTLSDSNTLHITGGQGVIYGRQWEITEGDITVTLPASGSLKGRLYVKIDLSNTTNPIELLVQTDVTLPDLTDDDQINVNNSVSELELYTFDVSSLTISNLVKTVETVADGDHADVVQMQNDISQLNSSLNNKLDIPTVVEQAITINASAGVAGSGYIRVWGKVVTLNAEIRYPSNGINLSLAWLQGQSINAYKPSSDTWLSCDYYSSSGKQAEAKISNTGNIVVSQPEGNVNLKISGSWVIN